MQVSRIYRILRLITMLQSGRSYKAADLASELQVSRRTIFRDLNVLEMAHIPYYFDTENRTYRINRHFFLPPLNLTLTEALALLLLTRRLSGASGLPLLSQGAKAALKLESALPHAVREHVGSMIGRMGMHLPPAARHEGMEAMFDELAGAVAARRICRIVYISFHEQKQIVATVHPLRLVFRSRAWYLIAHSARHKEVRTFKLSRIRKLTVTERTFTPDDDVGVDEHFGDAWGMIPEGKLHNIHLHFEKKVAGNVAEVQWHRSQRVEWNDDGSIEYYVRVDGLGEISWWLLGYGDQVEVIAPAELRRRVRRIAANVAAKYGKGGRS